MAKRVDPLKAKAAKQKKMAIGLAAMLLLVIAYQGPKTLKLLKGPQAAAPAATADPATPAAGTEVTPGVPAPTTGSPVGTPSAPATTTDAGSEPAVLANSDVPVTAGEGQLLSFEQFVSKDPFQQQVEDTTEGTPVDDGDNPPAPDDGAVVGSPGTDPSVPGSAESPPLSTGGSGSSGGTPLPATSGSAPAATTTISVNGVVNTVTAGTPFPADDPTFKLVSFAKDGKSVQIGVAGGSLAGGGATVKLTVGKPLTLQNQADGSRYKLELLTVEGITPSKG